MLSLQTITHTIDQKTLFTDLHFTVNKGDRLAILGRNGAGKSTLLKIMSQEIEPLSGSVILQNETVGYLSQELIYEEGDTVSSFMSIEPVGKAKVYLGKVGLGDIDLYDSIDAFSGGQKLRLGLAKVLSKDPTILLLDEPTNHLDREGVEWLIHWLKSFSGAVVVVSHDRYFLNQFAKRILELDSANQEAEFYEGNFDDYKVERQKRMERWQNAYSLQQREKKRLQKLVHIARERASVYDSPAKGKQLRSLEKRLQREVLDQEMARPKDDSSIKDIALDGGTHSGKLLIRMTDVGMQYGEDVLYEGISFELRGTQKMYLSGENGSGKSTLLKLITGELKPTNGIVQIGENVRIGYIAQMQEGLDPKKSLLDTIKAEGINAQRARSILGTFLFPKDDVFKRVENLSYGERLRLIFACFAQRSYDLLVLDEPTNHLDIPTREVIEGVLNDYSGAMLVVSHDQYFVDELSWTRHLCLEEGKLLERYL